MIGKFRRPASVIFAAAVLGVNASAYFHARAMLRFTEGGPRTASPLKLSAGAKVRTLLTGVRIPKPLSHVTPADRGLPFQPVSAPMPDGSSRSGWHIPAGPARGTALLFHGYACSKASLLNEAAAFHAMGVEVFLFDFRGHGESPGTDTTLGLREADEVAGGLDEARRLGAPAPFIFYGQSMGGAAVLRAVSKQMIHPQALMLEGVFDRTVSTVSHRFRAMGLPAFPGAQLLLFWGSVRIGASAFQHNPAEYARRVSAPTLVLHGERDPWVTPADTMRLIENLAGPKWRVAFTDAGHQSCLQADPALWIKAVSEFLSSNKF
jgi:alpha-beta hydrolase superfamily lysophospholipase